MAYLPPFNTIRGNLHIRDVKGTATVSATYDEFLELIRTMLSVIAVDETWYLEKYPDVAEGIKAGRVASARQHFMHNGYFEGRLPFPIKVEDRWYLAENPGVAEYIRTGRLESAQQHFDHDGYREGRLPFPL